MGSSYILRIVPRGANAANWNDEDDCDISNPCDLVLLNARVVNDGDGIEEVELERKQFDSGTEASKYLANMVRRK